MTQKDQDAILGRLIKEHQETRALLSDHEDRLDRVPQADST